MVIRSALDIVAQLMKKICVDVMNASHWVLQNISEQELDI